jgi:hypothetical protein
MTEKLENSHKAALNITLPEGWGFFFTTGLLVVFQDMPDLELVRKVASRESKEILIDENKFLLTFVSKDLFHWAGEGLEILRSTLWIKGVENMVLVFSCKFQQACKVFYSLKKRIS